MKLLEAYLTNDFRHIINNMKKINLFDLDSLTRDKVQKAMDQMYFRENQTKIKNENPNTSPKKDNFILNRKTSRVIIENEKNNKTGIKHNSKIFESIKADKNLTLNISGNKFLQKQLRTPRANDIEKKNQINIIKNEKGDLIKNNSELIKEKNSSQKQNEELLKKINLFDKEKEELVKNLSLINKEKDELTNKLNLINIRNEELTGNIEIIQKEKEELIKKNNTLNNKKEELIKEMELMNTQQKKSGNAINSIKNEKENLIKENNILKKEKDDLIKNVKFI